MTMLDKIKSMPVTVLAAIAFLLVTLVIAVILEPVLMGGFIFVGLLIVSIGRIAKYLSEEK